MSRDNPFAMHRQGVWQERAANPDMPQWVRVSALAFGCHRANGHANFQPGELGLLLGRPGKNGEWEYVTEDNVCRAIRLAKKPGWIAEESNSRCLVVSHHAVEGGLGNPNDKCSVHDGKRTGRRKTV